MQNLLSLCSVLAGLFAACAFYVLEQSQGLAIGLAVLGWGYLFAQVLLSHSVYRVFMNAMLWGFIYVLTSRFVLLAIINDYDAKLEQQLIVALFAGFFVLSALQYAVAAGLCAWLLTKRVPLVLCLFSLVLCCVLIEFLSQQPMLATPWFQVHLLFVDILPAFLFQTLGGFGISALFYTALACTIILLHSLYKNSYWLTAGVGTSMLFTCLLSIVFLNDRALIEHNKEPHQVSAKALHTYQDKTATTNPIHKQTLLDQLLRLSAYAPLADITIWPEGSLEFTDRGLLDQQLQQAEFANIKQLYFGNAVINNNQKHNIVSNKALHTEYSKQHFVPFTEWQPTWFKQLLARLNIKQVAETKMQPTRGTSEFASSSYHLLHSICFDLFFADTLKTQAQQAATLHLHYSDLFWSQSLWFKRMMLTLARLRAIEMRLPTAFSSNGGISALISADGVVLQQEANTNVSYVQQRLVLDNRTTLYSNYSHSTFLLVFVIYLLSLAAWLHLFVKLGIRNSSSYAVNTNHFSKFQGVS